MKFSAVATNTGPTINDYVMGVTAAGVDYRVLISNLMKNMYPVGSVYINASDNTNPGTLLGFGTWVAFGTGQVPVGINTSDTDFATAEQTGGEKAHQLTNGEMPTHSLTISHHGDESGSVIREFDGTGGTSGGVGIGQYRTSNSPIGGAGSIQSPTISWGSNTPHNNLQPYVVVYMWKRTA